MTFRSVEFHTSQWPEAVAAQLQSNLQAGRIPGRFLYDSAGQSARWLAYHEDWSPARTDSSVQVAYDRAFDEAASAIHTPVGYDYVSLGCGGGQKDARFIARAARRPKQVILTDTSPALVLTADRRVADAGATDIRRMVLDLYAWPTRDALGVDPTRPVLWSCLGILPNFDHRTLLPYLTSLLAPHDRLLVSANLSFAPFAEAEAHIVAQYDNPLARAWYDGALIELGLPLTQVDRRLLAAPLDAAGESWRIRYLARLTEPVILDVFGVEVRWPAGTELEVFHSTRHTLRHLDTLWAEAGLVPVATHTDEGREEAVVLVQRG